MRGTPNILQQGLPFPGLIPTYAGNTFRPPGFAGLVWGSSPRMRGTPSAQRSATFGPGLIPTYAGNTVSAASVSGFRWAHPHVCGEHEHHSRSSSASPGSSPRMRGTHYRKGNSYDNHGLIPTYAGNTHQMAGATRRGRAHPHVCGEHRVGIPHR